MGVFRCSSGQVRVLWKVSLALVLYLCVVLLLRFIPILAYTAVQTARGVDRRQAVEAGKALVFRHPVWSTVIGVIHSLMSLGIIWLLLRVIERRRFAWRRVGLDWKGSSVLTLAFGALLALLVYFASALVGRIFAPHSPGLGTLLAGVTVSAIAGNLMLYIPMGFGEELIFRGYIQTRLIERCGAICGILIGSTIFVLLHFLGNPLSPVAILSGVALWAVVGALYYWSGSLYLVGMFHGVANCLLNVLPGERSEAAGLTVHTVMLLLIVLVGLRRSRSLPDCAGGTCQTDQYTP